MQCPPRKETRSPSGKCVHRAARSRTYCRQDKREGLKKPRPTTSKAFWAAVNRRAGACADSRLHCLPEPRETQRSVVHPALYPVSPIILNGHTLRQRGRGVDRGDRRRAFLREWQSRRRQLAQEMRVGELRDSVQK